MKKYLVDNLLCLKVDTTLTFLIITMNEKENSNVFNEEHSEQNITLLDEYCDASTIHGVRYFGETYRPRMERIFWVIIFGISLIMCSKLTWHVIDNWQNHPVIISFEDKSTTIGSIPFPSVTLCPNNQNLHELLHFDELVDLLENINKTEENIELLDKSGELIETFFTVCMQSYYMKVADILQNITLKSTIVENFVRVHPPFNQIFEKCLWKEVIEDCRGMWMKSLTGSGICYTFNHLGYENILREEALHADYVLEKFHVKNITWSPEDGYDAKGAEHSRTRYPRNVLSAGFEVGLSLDLIGRSIDSEKYCGGIIPGFTMVVHSPNEIPQSLGNYVRIPFGQNTLVAIKPNMKTTTIQLKSYSPRKRQCFFSNERYLRFFKVYTQNNCELECLSNYTLQRCNCVNFYLPRTKDTPVCLPKDYQCTTIAYKDMAISEADDGDCECLASCIAINYDMEVSQSQINFEIERNVTETDLFASLSLFFKEDQFWTSKRSELYNIVEVIANIGGILGLFMGISILSVVELIYFLILHLIRKFKPKQN